MLISLGYDVAVSFQYAASTVTEVMEKQSQRVTVSDRSPLFEYHGMGDFQRNGSLHIIWKIWEELEKEVCEKQIQKIGGKIKPNNLTLESFPGSSVVKNPSAMQESICNAGDGQFNTWVGKIPWRRKWQPTPKPLPGKFHGQRSLEGYSPWSCKRTGHDLMTKQPTTILPYTLAYVDQEELAIECDNPRVSRGQVRATKNCQWRSIQEPAASVLVGEPGLPSLSVVRKKR